MKKLMTLNQGHEIDSCKIHADYPDDEKRFHMISMALMLVVNLYIFCNGMESFSKNKKKQSICNLFYRFLKGFLDKIEL